MPASRRTARSGHDTAAPDSTDTELVAAVRAGDLAAFEALFRSHYAVLNAYAARLVGSPDVADDIVEGVFVRIWERHSDWHVHGRVRSYLLRAVRNGALNHLGRERRHAHLQSRFIAVSPGALQADVAGPEEHLEHGRIEAAVRAAIAALPGRARKAFVLHRYHGKSQSEIADVMGVSPRTVENHIARAVRLLRKALSSLI